MGVYHVGIDIANDVNFDTVQESKFTPDMAGTLAMIAESEENYNRIMKAVGIAELAYLEESGSELIYEAADAESFLDKVKKWFTQLLEKVTAMFKSFIDMLRRKMGNDKLFAEKFEKDLAGADASKVKDFKGYKFSHMDDTSIMPNVINGAMKNVLSDEFHTYMSYDAIKEIKAGETDKIDKILSDGHDKVADKMRGATIHKDSVDAKEFEKEIFKYFRSGEDKKVEITNLNTAQLIKNIKDSDNMESTAKKLYKATADAIKTEIRNLDQLKAKSRVNMAKAKLHMGKEEDRKNYSDSAWNGKYIASISKVTSLTRTRLNILNTFNSGFLTAINARRVQSKAACIAIMKANGKKTEEKKDSVKESYIQHSFEDYLSQVVLK